MNPSIIENKSKPGYKKTPVGIIPEDWEVKKLISQVNVDKENINSDFKDEYINYVSLSDIENGKIFPNKIEFKSAPSRAKRITQKGDVLFATVRPNLKNFAIVDRPDIIASTGFAVLGFKKMELEFLYNFLFSHYAEKQYYSLTVGSNYPALNSNDVKSLKLPVPPIQEQKSIANCLSTWDSGIEKLTQLIEAKKLRKKGLMQQIFNGQLTIDNEQGGNEQFSINNEQLPVEIRLKKVDNEEERLKGWKEVKLGKISSIIKGEQLNREELTDSGLYPSYSGGISPSGYTDKSNWNANTITISEGGNSCGFVNFITVDFWLGGHCYAIEPKAEINKIFLYNLLKYQESKIMNLRVGSGLPNVQKRDLSKFKMKIPGIKVQVLIAEILQAADKEIELLEQKLDAFKEQKKGLMQVLLTGEKRLIN